MAEKRMYSKKITDSDDFIQMPASSQSLYFHLNQGADDDGFNNQIQIAMLKAHASIDDLKVLMTKNFIMRFESGVVVVKHWWIHNTLRKDRYTPTNFQEELKLLGIKDNKAYTFDKNQCRLPNGCQTVATDKYREDKCSLEENNIVSKQVSNLKEEINIRACESYDELLEDFLVKGEYRNAIFRFIAHLKVSFGIVMLNDRLENLIMKLDRFYDEDSDKVNAIDDAIVKGFKKLECE